jgi:hypothetical protein
VEVLGDKVRCDFRVSELHLPDSAYRSFFDRCMGITAGGSRPPAMKFLLLVTWIQSGQPPSNYQVPFNTGEACELARLQVIKDADRMRQDKIDQALRSGLGQTMAGLQGAASASVSAVCVAQ